MKGEFKIPGLITHLVGGEAIVNNLDKDYQDIINRHKEVFYIGTQGPDLFFYHFLSFLNKNSRNLGQVLHQENIKTFLLTMIEEANCFDKEEEREIAFSYIAGYLTHYVLDVNTHPYIYYKSGFSKKGRQPFQLRYSLLHRKLESNIDDMLYKALKTDVPRKEKMWELFSSSELQKATVAKLLSNTISKVYNRNVENKDIEKALDFMTFMIKALHSLTPKKKTFIKISEKLSIGEELITSLIQESDNFSLDFLNLKNKEWCSPWDDNIKHNTSFVDLYNKSMEDGVELLSLLGDFANGKLSNEEINEKIENRSLKTGVDADLDIVFKHHDIIFKNV